MSGRFIKKTVDLRMLRKAVLKDTVLYLLTAVYLIGVFGAAAVYAGASGTQTEVFSGFFSLFADDGNAAWVQVFLNPLLLNLFFLAVSLFSGFCGIGIPVVLILTLLKGAVAGAVGASLVKLYGITGFQFAGLAYAPGEAFCSLAVITACVQSFYMSRDVFSMLNGKSIEKINIRTYLKKYVLLLCFAVLGSVWMGLAYRLLAGILIV